MGKILSSLPPDEDRGSKLLALYWTQIALAIIIIAFRFYSRIRIQALGLDDWIMLFTVVLGIFLAVLATILVAYGGTRHIYYLTASQMKTVLRLNWMIQPLGIIALATSKISVAFVMLRIISPAMVWRRRFLYCSISSVFIISVVCSITTFAQCNPPRALWEFVPGAKCWDPRVQWDIAVFSASWNAFMDICFALLPSTIIWNLKMSIQKKIGLCCLLGLGIFAGICAGIKTSKLAALSSRSDITWATFDLYAWTSVEIFLIVVCGSIPTLKPLYDEFFAHRRFSISSFGNKPLLPSEELYPPSSSNTSSPAKLSKREMSIV